MTKPSLSRNILLLLIVKISGFAFPLVLLPYLAHTLEPESFGRVAIAQSFGLFLSVVVEYGFALSLTREISLARENKVVLSRLASRTHVAQGLLCLCVFGIALLVGAWVVTVGGYTYAFGASFYAIAIGIAPVWYYQGLERMKIYAIFDVLGKAISLGLIVVMINGDEDAFKVMYIQSAGPIFVSSITIFLIYKNNKFNIPSLQDIKEAFRSGFSMFLFRVAISFYTLANVFVLGLFVSAVQVAFYAASEKLARSMASMIGPVSQALYPRMAFLVKNDVNNGILLLKKTFWILVSGSILVSIIVCLFAKPIVELMLGSDFSQSITLLQGIVWIIPFMTMGNIFGIQWMLSLKMDKQFNVVVISAGIINLFLASIFASNFGAIGMVVAAVTAEIIVVIGLLLVMTKTHSFPFSKNLKIK